jgi:hypothetical protein
MVMLSSPLELLQSPCDCLSVDVILLRQHLPIITITNKDPCRRSTRIQIQMAPKPSAIERCTG